MKKQRWGRIINIGSEVFHQAWPNFSAYAAAKGGQHGWTRAMATELAPYGITVNMISPGWIPVERHATDPQEMKDEYYSQIPMCRWGEPRDVGDAVIYLASEEARRPLPARAPRSVLDGHTLVIDGEKTVLHHIPSGVLRRVVAAHDGAHRPPLEPLRHPAGHQPHSHPRPRASRHRRYPSNCGRAPRVGLLRPSSPRRSSAPTP